MAKGLFVGVSEIKLICPRSACRSTAIKRISDNPEKYQCEDCLFEGGLNVFNEGSENIDRKVKKMYIGVGGSARKVKKGYIGVNGVARLFFAEKIPLSKCAEGTLVKINEGGKLVDFYVAKHNYESGLNGAGRTLLVRKDCYNDQRYSGSYANNYAKSAIDSWLNNDYKNLLDADVQSLIGTTKFEAMTGNGTGNTGTLSRSVFLLSLMELGEHPSYSPLDGSELPISNTLKKAFLNGQSVTQWTRSPQTKGTAYVWTMNFNGEPSTYDHDTTNGSRPAFTLPENYLVDSPVYMWRKYKTVAEHEKVSGKSQVRGLTNLTSTPNVYVSSAAGIGREYITPGDYDKSLSLVYMETGDSSKSLKFNHDNEDSHQWVTSSYVKPQGSRGNAYQAIVLSKFTIQPKSFDDFASGEDSQDSVHGSISGNGQVYMLVIDRNGSSSPYYRYAIYRINFAPEYKAGDYVGEVYSSDPNAYPANGRHSDGYWYVR